MRLYAVRGLARLELLAHVEAENELSAAKTALEKFKEYTDYGQAEGVAQEHDSTFDEEFLVSESTNSQDGLYWSEEKSVELHDSRI